MTTLRIRKWEVWQSYRRDRGQPPWIKVHREIMRNPDWVALNDCQRGQLVAIWLLAADRDGVIPASPELVQKLCYMHSTPDLQVFIAHGFLEPDANVTPTRRQPDANVTPTRRQGDATEAETEAEKKQRQIGASTDAPPPKKAKKKATRIPDLWRPTEEHEQRAKEAGLNLKREADKFRAHAIEKGRTAQVWNAAFTRWLMNAEEYRGESDNGNGAHWSEAL